MGDGAKMLDADGHTILDEDGKVMLSNDDGDDCCCDNPCAECPSESECEFCPVTPDSVVIDFDPAGITDTGYSFHGPLGWRLSGSLAGLSFDLPQVSACSWEYSSATVFPLAITYLYDQTIPEDPGAPVAAQTGLRILRTITADGIRVQVFVSVAPHTGYPAGREICVGDNYPGHTPGQVITPIVCCEPAYGVTLVGGEPINSGTGPEDETHAYYGLVYLTPCSA